MSVYFGTDGIRGVYGKELTIELAFECGKALAKQKDNIKILIGRDTRQSGEILTLAISLGIISQGGDVVDVGICPTAGISCLTEQGEYDYGIVVTASHNPFQFNGIKIFDKDGRKLRVELEQKLEQDFFNKKNCKNSKKIGKKYIKNKIIKKYEKMLINNGCDLTGLKIVLDCANGAASYIAENVFKKLHSKVILINNNPNGININNNCGAIYPKQLQEIVLKEKADIGFAFDGDSDRLIVVDEKGNIIDGDKIVYLFSNFYLKQNKLNKKTVVGTVMTNISIEKELNKNNIELIRTAVGDKYIDEVLESGKLLIGGEQCGHIILKDKLKTGDGILNAIILSKIIRLENKKLSDFFNFNICKQTTKNIIVNDKNKCLNSKKLQYFIKKLQNDIKNSGRLLVRPSGTEPMIRIMVELDNGKIANEIINELENIIKKVDGEVI